MSSCVIGTIEYTGDDIALVCDWLRVGSPMSARLDRQLETAPCEAIPVDADALRQDLTALLHAFRRQRVYWPRG